MNSIVHHPSFHPVRSRANLVLFVALATGALGIFIAFLGIALAARNHIGESLLTVAFSVHSTDLTDYIQQHPAFNLANQSPRQCVATVARLRSASGLRFLARFPELDLNAPITHDANPFPDICPTSHSDFSGLRIWRNPKRASEGVPPLFSLVMLDIVESTFLMNPRFDLNQRGKHGETILFILVRDSRWISLIQEIERLDINAVDRHGNSAIGYAIVSNRTMENWRVPDFPCDPAIRNENGDTAWDLANSSVKRFYGPPVAKVLRTPVFWAAKFPR
jgi:hypothetical protein